LGRQDETILPRSSLFFFQSAVAIAQTLNLAYAAGAQASQRMQQVAKSAC